MENELMIALTEAINSIKNSDLLTGATLLTIMGSLMAMIWTYGKNIYSFVVGRIKRLIVFKVRVEHFDDMYVFLENWLTENHSKKYRNVICYTKDMIPEEEFHNHEPQLTESGSDSSKTPELPIKYKHYSDFIVIKYKGRRLYISKSREKIENASSFSSLFYDSFDITTIFGKKITQEFLKEIFEWNNLRRKKKKDTNIFNWHYGRWAKMTGIYPKKLSKIFLNDKLKEEIIIDFEHFIASEKSYLERGITYKRGYLFKGPPGNGKSSLAMALANKYKKDLRVLNISSIVSDNELIEAFGTLNSNSILSLEDIDVMFTNKDKEDTVNRDIKDGNLSFSTLLNCLDGVFSKHGVITIMTTNHAEKLDPALIRKGRIDKILTLDNPDENAIKTFMNNFYGYDLSLNGELKNIDIPMAEIQNLCLENDDREIKKKLIKI